MHLSYESVNILEVHVELSYDTCDLNFTFDKKEEILKNI